MTQDPKDRQDAHDDGVRMAEEHMRKSAAFVRDAVATCPFHPDRGAVRNGMCGPCAEMADDAR